MPRLTLTYGQFIAILTAHGFVFLRHGKGSHCRYRGEVGGKVYLVDVASHGDNKDIPAGTLDGMIRQSGLPKRVFRNPI